MNVIGKENMSGYVNIQTEGGSYGIRRQPILILWDTISVYRNNMQLSS